jgi:hypothetical protein
MVDFTVEIYSHYPFILVFSLISLYYKFAIPFNKTPLLFIPSRILISFFSPFSLFPSSLLRATSRDQAWEEEFLEIGAWSWWLLLSSSSSSLWRQVFYLAMP